MTLFDIIPFGIRDVVEIGLVAYVFYWLYQLMRGTIAVQILFGIGALYLIQVVVNVLDMTMLGALFTSISEVFVLAIIILFQPEIRRLLLLLGQNPLVRRFVSSPAQEKLVTEIVEAAKQMSKERIGALIVFERSTGLRNYIETGDQVQAHPTRDLLVTIFQGQNPLHDGAVIIRNRRLEAARCILPVSTNMRLSPKLGLRHRAAVGLTEQTDAFVVVVSEETGSISIAEDGQLIQEVSPEELRERLSEALSTGVTGQPEMASAEV